jgi:hypothetical protein
MLTPRRLLGKRRRPRLEPSGDCRAETFHCVIVSSAMQAKRANWRDPCAYGREGRVIQRVLHLGTPEPRLREGSERVLLVTNPQNDLQEIADKFHMMVGYCIAEWATVDEELFLILRNCLGPYEQSAIIYYRTPGLDVRLSLTDELVLSVLPEKDRQSGGHDDPSVQSWKKILGQFRTLLSVRRRIAHLPVIPRRIIQGGATFGNFAFNTTTFGDPGTIESSFEIYESKHEQLRGKSEGRSLLTVEDLQNHLVEVHALGEALRAFRRDVLKSSA